jgi:hypothetical protein
MSIVIALGLLYAVLMAVIFFKKNENSHIESYLESKNPQSPAEVEHWIREYDRKRIQF